MPLRRTVHRLASTLASLAALAICIAPSGCGSSRPETVPVRGQVTLAGGDWPAAGLIIFTPVEPAPGFPRRAGRAFFDLQGRFTAMTFEEGDGLMPGTYRAAVYCGEAIRGMDSAGQSCVPPKYQNPSQSGLELTVPAGADPIQANYNIPSSLGSKR
jgi:hypothetical protein